MYQEPLLHRIIQLNLAVSVIEKGKREKEEREKRRMEKRENGVRPVYKPRVTNILSIKWMKERRKQFYCILVVTNWQNERTFLSFPPPVSFCLSFGKQRQHTHRLFLILCIPIYKENT